MIKTNGIYLSLLLMLMLSTPPVNAVQIYTWVDENDVTHFSETPPADPDTATRLIDVVPTPVSVTASIDNEDFYSVVNQADRMESRRLENEKLTAEKKQAEAAATKERAEAAAIKRGANTYNTYDNNRYYAAFPYYSPYGHHPHKPGHGYGPKPVHPINPGSPHRGSPRTSLGKTPGMPR